MPEHVQVCGWVAPGYEAVRDQFAAALVAEPADPGAQLAVYVRGEQVVDLWGGDDVGGDTMTVVFSVSKAATSLLVALLVQEGVLELDALVPTLPFPLTLRELLGHRAGLIGVDGVLSPAESADDRLVAARLHRQRPYWKPGSAYGYHAISFGALVGAHVEQVTGHTVQELFRERLQAPYDLDIHLGFPQELEPRYRKVQSWAALPEFDLNVPALQQLAFVPGNELVTWGNQRHVRALGPASAGGVGNARGVARMFAAAISGVDGQAPFLTPPTIAEFGQTYSYGTDLVSGDQDHFGLGFEKFTAKYGFMLSDALAHGGIAGALGWGDLGTGIAYGMVRRRFNWGHDMNEDLGAAVVAAASVR